MYSIIVVFSNFFHDLSAALWFCSWLIIYILLIESRKADIKNFPMFISLFRRFIYLAYLSLIFIIVGGVFRTINYTNYEYLPSAGRGQITLLFIKHFLFFGLVILGLLLQKQFYLQIKNWKINLYGESRVEMDKVLKPFYVYQNIRNRIENISYDNRNFVLFFLYIFIISMVMSLLLIGQASSKQIQSEKKTKYQYDLSLESPKLNLPLKKVYEQTGIHLLEYRDKPELEIILQNAGKQELKDIVVEETLFDQGWLTTDTKIQKISNLQPGEKRRIIFKDLRINQGTITLLNIDAYTSVKDQFDQDNHAELKFVMSLSTQSQ